MNSDSDEKNQEKEKEKASARSRSSDETCARIEIAELDRLRLDESSKIGQIKESDEPSKD
jgi:hypothetical protein